MPKTVDSGVNTARLRRPRPHVTGKRVVLSGDVAVAVLVQVRTTKVRLQRGAVAANEGGVCVSGAGRCHFQKIPTAQRPVKDSRRAVVARAPIRTLQATMCKYTDWR